MKSLWKTSWLLIFFTVGAFISAHGQYAGVLKSISYDTLIIGTGNNTHSITLPKFDPSIGTLVSANINSTISVNYGFTLKNVEAVQRNFSVSVGRYDEFSSAALSAAYTNLIDTNIGSFLLDPGQSVSNPPHAVLYRYSQNDTVTSNVVNFLGMGAVNFNYMPITFTNLSGSNIYYYSATANDTTHFTITYYYYASTVLEMGLTSFSAERANDETVLLSWSMANPQPGMTYVIEKGTNESNLFPAASLLENNIDNNYAYHYQIGANETGSLYFRLKYITASGQVKYSEIKEVNIPGGSMTYTSAYPNPASDYINMPLSMDDWDIAIFSSLGRRIQQNHFSNTSFARIGFATKLTAGIYFIRAQNKSSKKQAVASFMVR